MGKIKRERQKYHITSTESKLPVEATRPNKKAKSILPMQLDAVENIFAGINIQLDNINKLTDLTPSELKVESEKPFDSQPVEPINEDSKQSIEKTEQKIKSLIPEKHLSKKEKMRLKHENLMAKLDVVAQARMQSMKKNKKSKSKSIDEMLLPAIKSVKSLLTPAAVRSQQSLCDKIETQPKNVFAIPTFNDDLPSLDSVFKLKPIASTSKGSSRGKEKLNKFMKSSKSIGKNKNNFVKNCNQLKKLMAKKK